MMGDGGASIRGSYRTHMEPTPEQFAEWLQESIKDGVAGKIGLVCETMAKLAYAAGADAELEACTQWLNFDYPSSVRALRAARRPKPPSLKQQAVERCNDYIDPDGIIRRAIESLPDD